MLLLIEHSSMNCAVFLSAKETASLYPAAVLNTPSFLFHTPQVQETAVPQTRANLFFFPYPCIKHHYIFITRRQMTKQERRRDEAANNSAARLVSLWETFDCGGAFHLPSRQRTQFYKGLQNGLLV